MNISRTLFLAWTGAIGATPGCYADAPPPQPPPPRSEVVQYPSSAYPAGPRAPGARYYYINSEGQRVPARVVFRRRLHAVGGATSDPTYRPAPPSLQGPSSEGSSTAAAAVAAAAVAPDAVPPRTPLSSGEGESCLDASIVRVPECSNLKIASSCAIRSFVIQKCNTYRDAFDPSVAAVAVDCMDRLSSRQLCDATNTYDCGKQALSEACPDTELAQLCAVAATSCSTTASDCTALLSGLNDSAKQQVARCISTGCHAGLYSCVEGLTSWHDGGKH
jgi:hypothetical protein